MHNRWKRVSKQAFCTVHCLTPDVKTTHTARQRRTFFSTVQFWSVKPSSAGMRVTRCAFVRVRKSTGLEKISKCGSRNYTVARLMGNTLTCAGNPNFFPQFSIMFWWPFARAVHNFSRFMTNCWRSRLLQPMNASLFVWRNMLVFVWRGPLLNGCSPEEGDSAVNRRACCGLRWPGDT